MKTIIVASTNPVKIAAARNGFTSMFPNDNLVVKGVSVPSGVSHQPMTSKETEKGALTRAENARGERPDADFWVGIEGGTSYAEGESKTDKQEMEAFAWVVILSKNGEVGRGKTGTFSLPPKIVALVKQGTELGVADDMVFGEKNSKQKMGAVGLLTNGIINRTEYYAHAVILALIRFKNEKIFHKEYNVGQ